MRFILLAFFIFCFSSVSALKVKGIVREASGEVLPFASVVVKGESIGTMANEDGEFFLDLENGKEYTLVVQYLGYKASNEVIPAGKTDVYLTIVLQKQSISLAEVSIGKGKEDPAYAIMRKAIAKSKIHDKQVDSYDANIYIKNALTINKVPLIFRKELAKNNIKIGVPFISESLMNLKFSQPNKRVTKVLAQKVSFDDINISGAFYLVNFYNTPADLDLVSPLSPKAFSYYKFEYLGYFEDNGRVINKIKVIPKSYGPGVCRGTIYIVDDLWCLHSTDVETVNKGFNIKMTQLYNPVKNVWVPISQIIDVNGKPFGFDFKAKLQVNPKYNTLNVNSKYVAEVKIVNEKDLPKRRNTTLELSQKEFSLKEMNRMAKKMEKEEKVAAKKEDGKVVSEDSTSYEKDFKKRSLEFWEEARSIPLTLEEQKGYAIGDSLKVVIALKDSLDKEKKQPFKPKGWLGDVFVGGDFTLHKGKGYSWKLDYSSPLLPLKGINYNIVEGVFTETQLSVYRSRLRADKWNFRTDNTVRYAFGIDRFMAKSNLQFTKKKHTVNLGGGSFSQTFDENQNIPLFANSILNLFKINLTQLYLKEGGFLQYGYDFNRQFKVSTKFEYAHRNMMYNLSDLKLAIGKREPTPNSPANSELSSSDFSAHNALIWSTRVSYQPGLRYRLQNGRKIYMDSNLPTFTFNYRKGFWDVDYDFVSLGVEHGFKTGPNEKLKVYAETGDFLNAKKLYLMDMKHVNSVNFVDATKGTYAFYRLLNTDLPLQISPDNYYRYSTQGQYIKLHAINEFRKLLVTQLPLARFAGLKEDLFVNYLKTPAKSNYLEVGYGIDGIFKLLRFEVITGFEKGVSQRWGWQIGITL